MERVTQEERLQSQRERECKEIDFELARHFFKGSQIIDNWNPEQFDALWRCHDGPMPDYWAETIAKIVATMFSRLRDDELALREHCRKIDRLPFKY